MYEGSIEASSSPDPDLSRKIRSTPICEPLVISKDFSTPHPMFEHASCQVLVAPLDRYNCFPVLQTVSRAIFGLEFLTFFCQPPDYLQISTSFLLDFWSVFHFCPRHPIYREKMTFSLDYFWMVICFSAFLEMLCLLSLLKILFASHHLVRLCLPQSHFATFVFWYPNHQWDHHRSHLPRLPQMHLCLHFCCCDLHLLPKVKRIHVLI